MRIERFDGMNETPAVRLSYECMLELMAKGQARPEVHLHWSFPCIVAYADDGEPVGAIVYEDRVKSARDIWIQKAAGKRHARAKVRQELQRGPYQPVQLGLWERAP